MAKSSPIMTERNKAIYVVGYKFSALQKFAVAPRKRYQDPKLVISIGQGPPVSNDNYALQYLRLQLKNAV